MRSLDQFLAEYEQTHRHPVNVAIHKVCVPLIVLSTVGLLWSLPLGMWLGLAAQAAFWINGATVALVPVLVFYALLGVRPLLAMTAFFALCLAIVAALDAVHAPLAWLSAAVWLGAWAAQFIGHRIEGAKPAFLDDLVFLLIGPIFVLAHWLPIQAERPVRSR